MNMYNARLTLATLFTVIAVAGILLCIQYAGHTANQEAGALCRVGLGVIGALVAGVWVPRD